MIAWTARNHVQRTKKKRTKKDKERISDLKCTPCEWWPLSNKRDFRPIRTPPAACVVVPYVLCVVQGTGHFLRILVFLMQGMLGCARWVSSILHAAEFAP